MEANVERPDATRFVKMFEDAQTILDESRKQAAIDLKYYHGDPLTAEEKSVLRARGQPDVSFNYVRRAINGIVGVVEKNQTDPKAYARKPNDEQAADVVTDVLRYVMDYNRYKNKRLHLFRDLLSTGTVAVNVEIDGEMNCVLRKIRPEEFFFDPRSREEDFSDARYLGIAKWMYGDEIKALYPNYKDEIGNVLSTNGGFSDTFEDKPSNQNAPMWLDKSQGRCLIVELYSKDGQAWTRCVFYRGGVLELERSAFVDDKGRTVCPIVASSLYVDDENNRYGLIRDMRAPQDEITKRRSKLLWHVSSSQLEVSAPEWASETSKETARHEASKPNGVIPAGYRRAPTPDMASGQMQLLQEAKDELIKQSPNPALLGREGASSGRAQLIKQESGLVELSIPFAQFEDWELRVYRAVWQRCKQYWDAPMYIRVTEDENAPRFIGINQPQMGVVNQVVTDAFGMPQMVEMPGQVGVDNKIADMDVDIILDNVPDVANVQQEIWQAMLQLLGNPQYSAQIPFDIIIEMSPVPNKQKLLDRLKKYKEESAGQDSEMRNKQMQLSEEKAVADIRETASKAQLNEVRAQTERAQMVSPDLIGVPLSM